MIIKKLTATFGSLKNRTLELKPGLNIIEGANESGKSTWCAFLRAMLYGIDSRERDTKEKKAEKNRFRPWSGEAISGRMELEVDGETIVVERGGTATSPMRDFRAYTTTGADAGYDAVDFGERMVGASREVFERSAFVSAPPLPSGSDELEKRILATVSSGDDSQSSAEAESKLREWQRKLRYNRRGEIPALEERIEKLRREAADCTEIDAQIAAAKHDISELKSKKSELEREIAAHDALEHARASQQLSAANARLAAANEERAALVAELPDGAPSADELLRLEREWSEEQRSDETSAQRGAIEREIKLADAQMAPIVARAGEQDAAEAERVLRRDADVARGYAEQKFTIPTVFATFLALFAAVSLVIGIISHSLTLYIGAAMFAVISVGGFVATARGRRRAARYRSEVLARYGASNESELERLADALSPLIARRAALEAELAKPVEQPKTPAFDRLSEIFGTSGPSELHRLLDHTRSLYERIAAADTAIGAAKSTAEALERAGVTESSAGVTASVTIPRDVAEAELRRVDARVASLERESALAEGTLGGRDATLLIAECERLEDDRERLERRYAAIELALKALTRANESMRERFSPALNADTARMFSELTDGRYDRVVISREFKPEAGSETLALHPAGDLSCGTVDQLWLALRLAVLHTALPDGTPLVLDDALVTFDDERLSRALELILRESETRQVLLFTCHTREGSLMRGRGGVNVVRL